MCAGNQCCPRANYGETFPCPSANPSWVSLCESPYKQSNCVPDPTTAEPCCLGLTAECLACSAGQSVEEYCEENPVAAGCEQPCCKAMTAECLACSAGQTEEEYCNDHVGTVGCPHAQATPYSEDLMQVSRNATETCAIGAHVQCPGSGNMCAGNQCCPRANYGATFPCPSADPSWVSLCESPNKQSNCVAEPCCLGLTAECLACSAGKTEEEFCEENPHTAGCAIAASARPCCMGLTAECLACSAGQSVEEYCEENPVAAGCEQPCCKAMTAECLACSAGQTEEEYCKDHEDTVGCEHEEATPYSDEDLMQVR